MNASQTSATARALAEIALTTGGCPTAERSARSRAGTIRSSSVPGGTSSADSDITVPAIGALTRV